MAYLHTCPCCSGQFKDSHSNRRFCSYSCAAKSRKRKQGQIFHSRCKQCGIAFSTRYKKIKTCCSPQCAGLYKRKGEWLTCPVCNKRFFRPPSQIKHIHCSAKCAKVQMRR